MLPEGHANAPLDKMQPVLRSVSESAFVHFYLACGHLITIARGDLGTELPSVLDCWACVAERSGSEALLPKQNAETRIVPIPSPKNQSESGISGDACFRIARPD